MFSLVLLLLFLNHHSYADFDTQALREQIKILRSQLDHMETLLTPQEASPALPSEETSSEPVESPPVVAQSAVMAPLSEQEEADQLHSIQKELIKDPLSTPSRRLLKNFLPRIQFPSVKAEALFFLGEVYYLREKLNQGKKNDNKKALGLFARSYSLVPNHSRTPKTLVRMAYCLSKNNQFKEAKALLEKVKTQYGRHVPFDVEQECEKLLLAITNQMEG